MALSALNVVGADQRDAAAVNQAPKRKKWWLAAAVGVLGLLGLGAGALWFVMNQPLYEPGMVRAQPATVFAAPAQTSDAPFWDVEPGIRLHHFASGRGENVLVVHGGPGLPATEPWPALAALDERYRFVFYDQRGCGRSTRPIDRFDRFEGSNVYSNLRQLDRALGLGTQVADIERIRRILGTDKLMLAGHSFGGLLAALYAAEFPQHVKALILVAPADLLVMPQAGGGLFGDIERRLPAAMKADYADFTKRYLDFGSVFAKSDADLVALNAQLFPYYAAAARANGFEVPPSGRDAKAGGGWMVQAMYFGMGRRHDWRAALKQATAPALVLHGAKDLQPESASRSYAQALPNAQFEVIAGAGHFPFHDQPQAFALVVQRFLGGLR